MFDEILGLSAASAAVYQALLDHSSRGVTQLAPLVGLPPVQVDACLDELAQLMLVRASSEHPGQMRAVTPEVGLTEMLARQEADLAARQAQLAASRAVVTRLIADRAADRARHGDRLIGMDAMRDRRDILMREVASECVGVHPGATQDPEDLDADRSGNAAAIARGVAVKSLYQASARNDPHTTAYAQWLLGLGGEVRTAPVLPRSLVIFDRSQALVPIDPVGTREGALHVTEPGIVAALVDLFEHEWSTAVPLGADHGRDQQTGLSPTEQELLKLLATGMTDEVAGKRLGVSLRTVRRQMAAIMERLHATSRFEAGLKAAQMGWL